MIFAASMPFKAVKKVKEIADAVGFKSPGYFCSVFKKAEGMMPDDFRRINAF